MGRKISRRTVMAGSAAVAVTAIAAPAGMATALTAALEPVPELPSRHAVDDIQRVVARHYALTVEEMLSPVRLNPMVRARQTAMYLSYLMSGKSLSDIGMRFKNRDHTTVLHAVRKIEGLRFTETGCHALLSQLAAQSIAAIERSGHGPRAAQLYAEREEKLFWLAQRELPFEEPPHYWFEQWSKKPAFLLSG